MTLLDRFDRTMAAADRLKACAGRCGVSLAEAGKLLGLSSLYVSAILIGIACRQLELLQGETRSRL